MMNLNLKVGMTIQTQIVLLAILIITTFSLGILAFAQTPTDKIVNDSSKVKMSNNSVTPNLKNLMANAFGIISSTQNDGNNTWIATGKWALVSNTSGVQNDSNPRFNATVKLVKSDNTERHNHEISDFKLTGSSATNNGQTTVLILKGIAKISGYNKQTAQVPVTIKIIETGQVTASLNTERQYKNPSWSPKGGTISLLINDKNIHSHFGNTPVYGMVDKAKVP
jgi:hypothetical protein